MKKKNLILSIFLEEKILLVIYIKIIIYIYTNIYMKKNYSN